MDIMIVDDAAFMRKILRDTLESLGHSIIGEASDGSEAVKLYEKLRPDVVTMDITMTEMDGITALKEIMDIDDEAKVIMVSAMKQTMLTREALEAGAVDFLTKPFTSEQIDNVLNGLTETIV